MKLMKFRTTTCVWCDRIAPDIEAYAKKNNLPVEEINVDEDPEAGKKYQIMGVPTLVIAEDDGTTLAKFTGYPIIKETLNE